MNAIHYLVLIYPSFHIFCRFFKTCYVNLQKSLSDKSHPCLRLIVITIVNSLPIALHCLSVIFIHFCPSFILIIISHCCFLSTLYYAISELIMIICDSMFLSLSISMDKYFILKYFIFYYCINK